MEAAVGVHAALGMKLFGQGAIVGQQFADCAAACRPPRSASDRRIRSAGRRSARGSARPAPRGGRSIAIPGPKRQPPRGKPVHVIQEHEMRNRPRVVRQKAFHRIGMRLDAIGQAIAKLLEILGLEVFRTTLPRIAARHVDPPEIVVAQRQPGENRLDAILHEAVDSARVLRFDLVPLGLREPPGARESNRGAWQNASTWTRSARGGGDRRSLAAGRRSHTPAGR